MGIMKRVLWWPVMITTFLSIFLFSAETRAAHVFLKSGAILKGEVVNSSAEVAVIRLKGGGRKIVRQKDILRTVYTDIHLGKVYVRLTSGEGRELYLVDEDRNSYVFREVVDVAKELKLKREDVLFIARKNPTGLKGKAEETEVSLQWNPPFNKIRHYRLYIKKTGLEYKRVETIVENKTVVKGLLSNSVYLFKVAAVDTDNYESIPSNEIRLSTRNIPPEAPHAFTCIVKKNGNTATACLSWEAAQDPDGSIKGYYVYVRKEGVWNRRSGLVKGVSHFLGALKPGRAEVFAVRAVDDRGRESGNSNSAITQTGTLPEVTIGGNFLLPAGRFSALYTMGYGTTLNFTFGVTSFHEFSLGLEAGFYRMENNAPQINKSFIIPVFAAAGYDFRLFSWLRIRPHLSLGLIYCSLEYIEAMSGELVKGVAVEPAVGAGVRLILFSKWRWNFFLSGEFNAVMESRPLMFFSFSGGITCRLIM